MKNINLDMNNFEPVNTKIENINIDNEQVLKVVKAKKIMEFDENTYAKLIDSSFHNGVIEVKMLSRLLKDAPDFARGFIGIAYRINEEDTKFESFYLRPANGRTDDPIRIHRACQYFSYPKYTFEYFRSNGIQDYEAKADIGLNEWIQLKAVIEGAHGRFYVNDQLVLTVKDMKHGPDMKGQIGLFVDIGTEAFFKDLKVTNFD